MPKKHTTNHKRKLRARDDDSESDTDSEIDASVTSVHNDVYFYCDVTRENVLKMQKVLHKLSHVYDHIKLHIHSDGGCAFSGLFAMDCISRHNVTTIAEGMCASAATFMLLAGRERQMSPHSILLIHEVSSVIGWSKFSDLKADTENAQLLMDMILKIYKDKTRMKKKELEKMLKHDKYIDAEQAQKVGFIDSVTAER